MALGFMVEVATNVRSARVIWMNVREGGGGGGASVGPVCNIFPTLRAQMSTIFVFLSCTPESKALLAFGEWSRDADTQLQPLSHHSTSPRTFKLQVPVFSFV